MIGKFKIERPNVAEADRVDDDDNDNDRDVLDVSSQPRSCLVTRPKEHLKQSSICRLKSAGSDASPMRKLANQFLPKQSGNKRKTHCLGGSIVKHSHENQVARFDNSSRSAYGARSLIKSESGLGTIKQETHTVGDVQAALALMKMSIDVSGWLKPQIHASGGNQRMSRVRGIKLLIGDQSRDKDILDNRAPDAVREAMNSAGEDSKGDKSGSRLQFTSLQRTCCLEKNHKKRKASDFSCLPQVESTGDGVAKEKTKLCERYGNSDIKEHKHVEESDGHDKLSLLSKKKKKADRRFVDRLSASDHQIKYQKVLEEGEPTISSVKKQTLKQVVTEPNSFDASATYSSFSSTEGLEDKLLGRKDLEYALRSPTIPTGISFSIIHLLSAIRTALVTHEMKTHHKRAHRHHKKKDGSSSQAEQNNLPCLTIHEIVERVRLNPGDSCILEAREPLEVLVRGALKLFSSRTAPEGVKDWKVLTLYSKSHRSWSWVGPVSSRAGRLINCPAISHGAWGLPGRSLRKLVDSFTDWLKSAEGTLQKIGSLHAPPPALIHVPLDVEERKKGLLGSRKTIPTISPCSEEVRAYFHKEEALRYLFPETAFSYTALDGRKSTVAPLRCGGKASSKCREHFMLKADRPPHITVLSLVRDAAARLPACLGSRADICILLRDSQYVVEGITEEQLNQAVRGALDRLHYETDPCVQFNAERKLWIYLHRDRKEDEFEDDGISSMRRRKQKR